MGDVVDDEVRPLISASVPDSECKGCGSSALCDPRRALHRYFVLIFICFLSFGNYGCCIKNVFACLRQM